MPGNTALPCTDRFHREMEGLTDAASSAVGSSISGSSSSGVRCDDVGSTGQLVHCRKDVRSGGGDPGRRILIAEDDRMFRELLVRRAKRSGFDVLDAENASHAVSLLQSNPIDLLVVDMYMPDGTGLDVLAEAKKLDEDILAIVMTGSASVQNTVEALRAGVFDFLVKPLNPLQSFDLAVVRAMEQRHLVRENRRLFQENQRLALHDPLTGLFNRFQMRRILEAELQRCSRYNRQLSVLMIDLDQFKKVNDTYGHLQGDKVLVHAAEAICASIRSVDSGARFGGDEFVVIMPEADLHVASEVGWRIIRQVGKPVEGIGRVCASVGRAVWEPSMGTIEALLKEADQSLYRSKARRRAARLKARGSGRDGSEGLQTK